jgi:hypothetical protein
MLVSETARNDKTPIASLEIEKINKRLSGVNIRTQRPMRECERTPKTTADMIERGQATTTATASGEE